MSGVEPRNQLSRASLVVPVLPAIGRPSAARRPRGAARRHAQHHVHDLIDRRRIVEGLARIDDLGRDGLAARLSGGLLAAAAAGARLVAVDGLAVAVLHAVDQRGRDLERAVGQHGVGHGHAQQGGLAGAQRHRQVGAHLVDDAEFLGDLDHLLHADLLGHAHGHEVARQLEAAPHRGRPEKVAAVVLGRPDRLAVARVVGERRVEHDRGRREARNPWPRDRRTA